MVDHERNERSGGVLGDIWQGLVDLVYPPKCLVCDDMQPDYLCGDCIKRITRMSPPLCTRCGGALEDGRRCDDCRQIEFSFNSAIAYGAYEGVLKDAIHQFKYSGHTVIAPILSSMLVDALQERHFLLSSVDCIVPMPIHTSRARERGFNQSELLAAGPGKAFALPVLKGVLVRARQTKPQVELSGDERIENMLGAFVVLRSDAVADRRVLLIDDVFTTGSTCEAASAALRLAGAREIHVLTVARDI